MKRSVLIILAVLALPTQSEAAHCRLGLFYRPSLGVCARSVTARFRIRPHGARNTIQRHSRKNHRLHPHHAVRIAKPKFINPAPWAGKIPYYAFVGMPK